MALAVIRVLASQRLVQVLPFQEGTTNLLTANQASVETDTTGFNVSSGTTISRDTTEYWHGAASLKVVTDGSIANQGVATSGAATTVSPNTKYSCSAWVKGSGSVLIRGRDDTGTFTDSSAITLTSAWQRLTVTHTTSATAANMWLSVLTSGTQAITFYADGLQIEQKAYATEFVLGGITRLDSPQVLASSRQLAVLR